MGHGGGPWHGRVKRQDSLHFEFSPLIFLSPDRRDIGKLLSGQLAQRSRLSLVKLAKHSRASQCLPSTLCSYLCLTDAYSNGLALAYATSPVWCSWRSQSFLCYSLTNGLWQGLAGPTHITNQCFRHPTLMWRHSAGILGPRMLLLSVPITSQLARGPGKLYHAKILSMNWTDLGLKQFYCLPAVWPSVAYYTSGASVSLFVE